MIMVQGAVPGNRMRGHPDKPVETGARELGAKAELGAKGELGAKAVRA